MERPESGELWTDTTTLALVHPCRVANVGGEIGLGVSQVPTHISVVNTKQCIAMTVNYYSLRPILCS